MLWAFLLSFSVVAQIEYTNPVIHGNFPDPSLLRVDDNNQIEYWAVTTGEQAGHAFPLFHSKNLRDWERAPNVWALLNTPSWTAGAFWAPEISQGPDHKFYVFYSAFCDIGGGKCPETAKQSTNPHCLGVAIANAPGGPYQSPDAPIVCDHWGSIDPMAYWDSKTGKQYLFWKEDTNNCACGQTTKIWGQQFVIDNMRPSWVKPLGEQRCLIENDFRSWEDQVVEGPFVLKHGNYFYLFYAGAACCEADKCNYAEGVARATAPLGPYFKDPANPILAGNASWKCPGHGSIVTTPDCRTFLLHHAFSRKSEVSGRQAVLDEIEWKPDDWPIINDYQGVASAGSVPPPSSKQRACDSRR
jgi:xylan 1,4-beta-xylosidase